MPRENRVERRWAPHEMILKARSLQKVAHLLESDREPSLSDALLFEGKIIAAPILLSLATEIALKAWQCRERGEGKAPDYSHDLLDLFDGLSEESRTRLQSRLPAEPDPFDTHRFFPIGAGMRKTLKFHRRAFEDWRYIHETMRGSFYQSVLHEALTVIIETYYSTQPESS